MIALGVNIDHIQMQLHCICAKIAVIFRKRMWWFCGNALKPG